MRPNDLSIKAETHSEDEVEPEDSEAVHPTHTRQRRFSGDKSDPRHHVKIGGVKNSNESSNRVQTIISRLFGTQTLTKNVCRCGMDRTQESLLFLCFLVYSESEGVVNGPDEPLPLFSFVDVLQKSLCLEQVMQAWCDSCNKYQTTVSTANLSSPISTSS